MGSVYIVRRETQKKGTRWHVRYERDRITPAVHLGVFPTEEMAKARRLAAQIQISHGREPSQFEVVERSGRPLRIVADEWLATLVDVEARTLRNYTISVQRILLVFGARDPSSLTRNEVQAWVAGLSKGVVRLRLTTLAQLLDYAGIDPNPARGRIRKAKRPRPAPFLPTRAELELVYAELGRLQPERVHACQMLEHLGLRVNELLEMPRSNVDRRRKRVFVERAKSPAGVRFVDVLDDAVTLPKAGSGRCFSFTDQALRESLRRACEAVDVPRITPHDLRHLHASRMLHSARLSPVELQHRLGHEKLSTTLDVYSHLMPPDDE